MRKFVTSECVSLGHPDKVADYISDSILTAYLIADKQSHCAIETLVTTDTVIVAGEIKSAALINHEDLIRKAIGEIGYLRGISKGFDVDATITNLIHSQSADIDQGVSRASIEDQGAGDQGIMVGYASDETEEYMPLPTAIARAIINRIAYIREIDIEKKGSCILLPDGKSQVTVVYDKGVPVSVDAIVVSNQHTDIDIEEVRRKIISEVIIPVLSKYGYNLPALLFINPTGRFVIGGPDGDTGLTGRKIVVDQYGPVCPVGGGAFSGKDPSKVDRSAAYAARYVAKNIVAAGLAKVCEVQLSYAIGIAQPTSVLIDTKGTCAPFTSEEAIALVVSELFDLRPYAIEKNLKLRDVDYAQTVSFGPFGHNYFPWEQTDKADILLKKVREEIK